MNRKNLTPKPCLVTKVAEAVAEATGDRQI